MDARLSMALGVASAGNDFRLAVRVQNSSFLKGPELELIKKTRQG
jgi:hypothetical protein